MIKDRKIREEVEKTLDSFNYNEEIEANPFLYTRIMAQVSSQQNEKAKKPLFAGWLLRLCFIILLTVNVTSLVIYFLNNSYTRNRSKYILSFDKEYSISTNNDYRSILLNGNQ